VELRLRRNRIAVLPEGMTRLRTLRFLDLRENPLAALPDWLAELPALQRLDLRWNGFGLADAPPVVERLRERGCVVWV
jgi:Leucine-rich repeat (LRR) protein